MAKLVVRRSPPLRGAVSVPGDKSISHRALLFGALAEGDTRIRGWLPATDCYATLNCVRALGVAVDELSAEELVVHGAGARGLEEPGDVLDCGGSGTAMRLLAGILAGHPFTSVMTGNPALRGRPMGRIIDPLRQMGATLLGRTADRYPPLTIRGGNLQGIRFRMPVASAQVKSAVLLAGLFAEGETRVIEPGPARDHTERMLRAFGVELDVAFPTICIAGGQRLVSPGEVVVPGDFSSAAFPLVAASIVPDSEVRIRDVGFNPTRTGLYELLADMGAKLGAIHPARRDGSATVADGQGEPLAELVARHSRLTAVPVEGEVVVRAIDEFPILAVAATQAHGATEIRGAAELRVKEADRISTVAEELRRMGAVIEERPDGMLLHGPVKLRGTTVQCHADHRLAMALAVAGLVADGETVIEGAEVVNDSFPGFAATMQALRAPMTWVP